MIPHFYTFDFSVQPNLRLTLNDPGVISNPINFHRKTFPGIIHMGNTLFGSIDEMNKHIRIYDPETDYWQLTDDYLDNSPHDVSRMNRDITEDLDQGRTWTQAIELNEELLHPITQKYTVMFTAKFPLDSPLKESLIVQFNDLEFLQGAISICQWFNLDPHDHITNLHEGDTAIEFTF